MIGGFFGVVVKETRLFFWVSSSNPSQKTWVKKKLISLHKKLLQLFTLLQYYSIYGKIEDNLFLVPAPTDTSIIRHKKYRTLAISD